MLKNHRFLVAVLAVLAVLSCGVMAQVAGQNINMVSGTVWPSGDPFLQRQNEPSVAVSTRNPQHLLAGANDYRSVDIQNPAAPNELGDAWLGVFSSTDGGDKWQSTLMPGYPQDSSAIGVASPLHGYAAATDPTVRAGTHGLFYYSGLVFNRGSNAPSAVFVSVFQDQNNKGNGTGAIQTTPSTKGNPIQYLNANLVDTGTSGQFLDKPWLVVDIPRTGRIGKCKLNGQSVQSGYVYLFYTKFSGSKNNPASQIKETVSTDCGKTWSNPQTISQSSKYNQGTVAAVDPNNGNVWVAWRQISLGNQSQPDSFLYSFTTNGGAQWTQGSTAAYTFKVGESFDQNSNFTTFRTIDVPALAVDKNSRVWLAFSKRVPGPISGTFGSRIMISTLQNGATSFAAPYQADSTSPTATAYGYQFMPSFAYAYGKLMLVWYDTRYDNQQISVTCTPGSSTTPSCTESRQPIPGSKLDGTSAGYSAVFKSQISDPTGGAGDTGIRHTVDVFGAMIDPAQVNTQVPAKQISQYRFYIDITNNQIKQAEFNVPNLPEFVQGTVPFIGDYIDVAGLTMLPTTAGLGWKFTDNTISPVFHTTWTDNRDVIPPPYAGDGFQHWEIFSPPGANGGFTSIYNPLTNQTTCQVGYSGDRNENVYTSRITSGLVIGVRENQKAVTTTDLKRSFSLFVRNTNNPLTTPNPIYYRIFLGTTSTAAACTNSVTGGTVSFPAGINGCFTDVAAYPNTSVAQSINVTANSSTNPNVTVNLLVAQLTGLNGTVMAGGAQAIAIINGDPSNPNVVNPDNSSSDPTLALDTTDSYSGLPQLTSGESYDPTVAGAPICDPTAPNSPTCPGTTLIASPSIASPSIASPSIASPSIASPSIASPSIASPSIASPSITTVATASPSITNPYASPSIASPSIASPSIVNFATASPSITSLGGDTNVTDYSWKINNKGNTSSSYDTQQFIRQASNYCGQNGTRCQLIAHKTYASPTVGLTNGQSSCQLAVAVADITQASIPDPAFTTASGLNSANGGADASNASISLAPGEGTRLTLRVFSGNTNPIPTIPGTNVFPITPIASAKTPNTGQANVSRSLTILTAVLPVAIVGQPYTTTGSATGSQVALQSIGGVFGLNQTPVWSLGDPFGTPPYPLPVSPLTLGANGKISTDVVTAAPSPYQFTAQVKDFASPTPNLDAQFLNILVNRFWISDVAVTIPNEVGSSGYMKAGDVASVVVTVSSQGPADASNVLASLSYAASAAGTPLSGAPVLSCVVEGTNSPSPTPQTIMATGAAIFRFTCTASPSSGSGYVNFTANATADYFSGVNHVYTVKGVATPVTQPPTTNSTPPNVIVDTVQPTLVFGAPMTAPNAAGWYKTPVVIPYSTSDNLSGVSTAVATSPATANGTAAAGTMTLNTEGTAVTGTMTATDFALNAFSPTSGAFKIDRTPPTFTATAANADLSPYVANTWTNQTVVVTFTCSDTLSGVGTVTLNPAGNGTSIGVVNAYTKKMTITGETAGLTVSGTCTDVAGNTTDASFGQIKIDKTPPSISSSLSPPANANGWNNTAVQVTFLCSDNVGGSGVASLTGPTTLSAQGANQVVPGTCFDVAGNNSSTSATVNIDLTNPSVAITAPAEGATYAVNQSITTSYLCTDPIISGPGGCIATPNVANGSAVSQSTPGSYTFSVQGTDLAGNPNSATSHYTVAPYTFTGFQPPLAIAGSAAAPTASGSFVQGAVVPMAWQLTLANNAVTDTTTLASITTYPNPTCTGVPGGSGTPLNTSTLAYDTPNSRFLYNWDTTSVTAGCYYVVVAFTDGTSYATNINLAPSGTIVNALQFTGADYIDGTNVNLPQTNASRTIEAWINPSSAGAGTIFDFGAAPNHSALVFANHHMHFVSEQGDIGGTQNIPLNQWTHVAVSYDGAQASLYVNGVLDVATAPPGPLNTTGTAWRIGADAGATATQQFAGTIDEVKVWSTARTQAEITTLSNELCTSTNGLVAYYKFNQGTAGGDNSSVTSLIDSSASSSDGTLTGFALTGATSNWVTGSAPAFANQLSISVTPLTPTIISNATQQFTATGTCTDATTADLTSIAVWSSSDPSVATIDNAGLATANTTGTTSINAKSAGVSGTPATLTVQ